jgi:hypothetical protein
MLNGGPAITRIGTRNFMAEFNPFEAPAEDSRVFENPSGEMTLVLTKFRQQIVALGGLWIFSGVLGFTIGCVMFARNGHIGNPDVEVYAVATVTALLALVLMTVGVFACIKKIWAVYVGLGLSYLSLLTNVLGMNVCGLAIIIVVVIQAHRVIGYSKTLLAAGIPLNSKP